jgi:N-acetylglucosamine-6-phosphate deacetylase
MTGKLKIEGVHYQTGKPVCLELKDGFIADIKDLAILSEEKKDLFVSPGLIDNQVNGYVNVDFSGNNLTAEGVLSATEAIRKDGVTTFIPTIITNSHINILRNLGILEVARLRYGQVSDSVPGYHLEGPYLSPEEGYRGCHQAKYMRKPSWSEFMEYQKAAGGRIIQVTVAPEIEGMPDFIRRCSSEGIVVAIGHTNASAEQIDKAVDNGATVSTHLGNGCANLIHRHNNPIWPQLANERLTASIIADGHHLLPDEIKVFYKAKGADNLILTSDIIYLAGMAPGRYSFLETDVVLTSEGMLLNEELGCLAGASFPLKKGVENFIRITGCYLSDAIKISSENVARIYGLKDRGSLEPGKRADIIVFKKEGEQINIKETFIKGKEVFLDNGLTIR